MNNSNALYNSLLKDAVNEKNKLTVKTLNKIIKIYESTADDLLKKASTSRGFTRAWTKDYERYIKYKILELNNELAKVSDSSIRTSAEIAASVQGDFLSYINNKYTLDIDKSMLEFAYTTNEKLIGQIIQGGFYKDNRSLSDRIWGYGNQNGKDIQYILTKGMAEQKSYLDIIKDLEKFLKSNTDPDFKKTYTKLYNRKVDYNAQRLLRTAMNHMFYVQNVSNAKNNPYAEAMHWELSAEHGTRQVDRFGEDECDDYANSDYYNLGQGNFPPDKVPVPHPNCLCIQTIVIPKSLDEIGRELGEWINGKDISYLDEWLKVG
ncbi:MAG: hypothetical protein E7F58_00970 [Clostridium saudiense]|uniref:hypothetical protein n=1 Tax=Clostridium saudiense TaxID=1414720 RepID=UPI00290CD4AA|nr:hypothetical protein [Clostridium saudiense]MDU3520219.1 hypothetical protein [Clostridium saudiense]